MELLTSQKAFSTPQPQLTIKMVNTKAKGSKFEREVKKALEKQGFFISKQSASRFPDLIGISPSQTIYFIECKVNKYISSTEKEKLLTQNYAYPLVAYPTIENRKKVINFKTVDRYKLNEEIFKEELPY